MNDGSKHDRAWRPRKRTRNERARNAARHSVAIRIEVIEPPTVAYVAAIADVENPSFRMAEPRT